MKYLLSLMLLVAVVSSSISQRKIKKGTIYENDVAVAKVDGKVGFLRMAHLDFMTTDGKPVVSVEEQTTAIKYPPFKEVYWYKISFPDTKKQLIIERAIHCKDEECIIDKVLGGIGIAGVAKPIENQDEIIATSDISAKIQTDTTIVKSDKDAELMDRLMSNKIIRTKADEPLVFSSDGSNLQKIMQGKLVIGWVAKESSELPKEDIYTFYKQSVSDPKARFEAAYIKILVNKQKLFTYQDGKYEASSGLFSYMIPDPKNAEELIAKYLIAHGYL